MKARQYACARCGRRVRPERWVYSRHTGNRYCVELDACAKRARRRKKLTA
jgi:hypothetical protein